MKFWSTRESINNEIYSVSAIMETVAAVAAYWIFAVRFETYLPLVISAIIAPLVLLRSDDSVNLGVTWFDQWTGVSKKRQSDLSSREVLFLLSIGISGLLVAALIGFMLTGKVSGGAVSWWGGVLYGTAIFAIACAAALAITAIGLTILGAFGPVPLQVTFFLGVIAAAAGASFQPAGFGFLTIVVSAVITFLLFFVVYAIGMASVFLGLSLTARFAATACHIKAGLLALPRNFRLLILCTSPIQEPELVPGLTSITLRDEIRNGIVEVRSGPLGQRLYGGAALVLEVILWFLPAWFYRISLKSTAWLWWPLAFLGAPPKLSKNPDWFYRQLFITKWARTIRPLSYLSIAAFVGVSLWRTFNSSHLPDNPFLSVIGYAFAIEWTTAPWQLLGLFGSLLSLAIVYLVDWNFEKYRIAVETRDAALAEDAQWHFRWIEYVSRLRTLLFVAYCVLVGFHAFLILNARSCWITPTAGMQSWSVLFYQEQAPKLACTKST
jgi:hypothetical protein